MTNYFILNHINPPKTWSNKYLFKVEQVADKRYRMGFRLDLYIYDYREYQSLMWQNIGRYIDEIDVDFSMKRWGGSGNLYANFNPVNYNDMSIRHITEDELDLHMTYGTFDK